MPTARELLDQADALMRRNRALAPGDDIPTLLDSVSADELGARAAPAPKRAPPPRIAEGDSEAIPVLTDAVEEIEAPPLDEPPYEDDPSIWPETLRGVRSIIDEPEETTAVAPPPDAPDAPRLPASRHGASTTGPGAAAAAGVRGQGASAPGALGSAPSTSAASGPAGGVAPARSAPPSHETEPRPVPASPIAFTLDPEAPRPEPEIEVEVEELLPLDLSSMPAARGTFADAPSAGGASSPAAPETSSGRMTAAAALAHFRPVAPPPEPEAPLPAATSAPSAQESEVRSDDAAPATSEDAARWASLAEEIRMQVLQRIDLFTDTGLREQLGERLKPIVDRASADLVATINQHVGELLRAYVAEAIEREIDRWRDAH